MQNAGASVIPGDPAGRKNPYNHGMNQVAAQAIAPDPAVDRAQSDPAWDWRGAPARGDTDAATARAARAKRIAWRLENPDEWRAELAQLPYYDPDFDYDPEHEYGIDWATDPMCEGLVRLDIDEDGFVTRVEDRHKLLQVAILATLRTLLAGRDRQVVMEPRLYFDNPAYKGEVVRPDLVVSQRHVELPPGRDRDDPEHYIRLEEGDPVPHMAMEITSPGSRRGDLNARLRLYADLGIAEYLVFDGRTTFRAPISLIVHRLQADGTYAPMPNVAIAGSDVPTYFSSELATRIRLVQPTAEALNENPDAPPRFQWWDADRTRWRDRDSDAEYALREERTEGESIGEARGETRMGIRMLHALLADVVPKADRDRIAADWREHGAPADAVDRIAVVQKSPRAWRTMLDVRPTDREQDADTPPPARDSGPRRGDRQW